jgi:hypothetical protein
VIFPVGVCLTSTIAWRGQSFSGAGATYSTVRGMPGQDVFAGLDAPGSYLFGAYVHDIQIQVDNSVNASATANGGNNAFPHRISGTAGGLTPLLIPPTPGPIVFDPSVWGSGSGSMSAGDNLLTVSDGDFEQIGSEFVVGAPVTVNGAGANGKNLTTTIKSVINQRQVRLKTSALTKVTNAAGTWGVSLTPPWYFGNCGIAVPESDGAYNIQNVNGWTFERVWFSATPGSRHGFSCGLWMQAAPNALHFYAVTFQGLWGGYIEALPNKNLASLFAWTPDTSAFRDVDFKFDTFPAIFYNGSHRILDGFNIYGGEQPYTFGLMWFTPNTGGYPSATITGYYDECWTMNSGEHARFSGIVNILGGNLGACGGSPLVVWNGSNSTVDAQVNSLRIIGNNNTFRHAIPVLVDKGQHNAVNPQ